MGCSTAKEWSWTAGLPAVCAEALNVARLLMKGKFNESIYGMLGSPPAGGVTPEHFWAGVATVLRRHFLLEPGIH